MAGQKRGGLTVIRDSGKRSHDGAVCWEVHCQCGTIKHLTRSNFLRNQSCGCQQKELLRQALFKGVGQIYCSFWKSYVQGAKVRRLEFDITMEYAWELFLKQDKKCTLTGDQLTFQSRSYRSDGTASLDRIDALKGYVEGNVQWVHKNINMMKQQYSTELFLEWCQKVVNHNKS